MKIYLDNCCFNRPFDDQSQVKIHIEAQAKLDIQKNIKQGNYDLVWSYILEYENEMNPFEERKESIIKWKNIAKEKIVANSDIISLAESICNQGIKPKDALHISCAIYAKCKYFITTDRLLLNKNVNGIKIINPTQFILEEAQKMVKSDTILKLEGINLLIDNLGEVDAERFITLIIKEPFDYTKWQKKLFQGKRVKELSNEAMANYKK